MIVSMQVVGCQQVGVGVHSIFAWNFWGFFGRSGRWSGLDGRSTETDIIRWMSAKGSASSGSEDLVEENERMALGICV